MFQKAKQWVKKNKLIVISIAVAVAIGLAFLFGKIIRKSKPMLETEWQPSEDLKKNIKIFERGSVDNIVTHATKDPAGNWEIGWGHYLAPGDDDEAGNTTMTEQEVKDLFETDIRNHAQEVRELTKGLNLTQGQRDALLDFHWGYGNAALKGSTLFKKILAKAPQEEIVAEFNRWTKAKVNGEMVDLPGLVKRRAYDVSLWTA